MFSEDQKNQFYLQLLTISDEKTKILISNSRKEVSTLTRKRQDTTLYHGLPAVYIEGDWVVFSPYSQQIIHLSEEGMEDSDVITQLKEAGFFSEPSVTGPGEHASCYQTILITTNACNLECIYCFAFDGTGPQYMSDEVARAAVRYCINMASSRSKEPLISFFGGEPTLTIQQIEMVIGYARSLSKAAGSPTPSFSISTNGVMSEHALDVLLDNNFSITLSMDGLPEIQNLQRPMHQGVPTAPRVEATIKELACADADFFVRTTVTGHSVETIPDAVAHLASLGVKRVHFEAINVAGRAMMPTKGEVPLKPDAVKFASALIEAIKIGDGLDVGIMNSSYMNMLQPSAHFCDGAGGNRIAVTPNGEVTACLEVQGSCHPSSNTFLIGRYDENKGELTIDPTKKQSLCSLVIPEINQECASCFAKYICGGGCPIRNIHASGDPTKPDQFNCTVTKEVLPFVIGLVDRYSNRREGC